MVKEDPNLDPENRFIAGKYNSLENFQELCSYFLSSSLQQHPRQKVEL